MAWKLLEKRWLVGVGIVLDAVGFVGWTMKSGWHQFFLGVGTAIILLWLCEMAGRLWRMEAVRSDVLAWRQAFVDAYRSPLVKVHTFALIYILTSTILGLIIGTWMGRSVAEAVLALEHLPDALFNLLTQ